MGGNKLTATNGCPARLEQVDVVLVLESVNLLGSESSVGKHSVLHPTKESVDLRIHSQWEMTDLLDDVLPGTRGLEADQFVIQRLAHRLDA